MNALAERLIGLAVSAALGALVWALVSSWGQIARPDQWTGIEQLRVLRPWLAEFRLPIIAVVVTLLFTAAHAIAKRARLGD